MEELVGQIIDQVLINEDQSILAFKTDDGRIIAYNTYGGCCSETWFADIIGLDSLLGYRPRSSDNLVNAYNKELRRIISVEESDMTWYNVEDGRSRQQYDSPYGYKITTHMGRISIAFRNSSNGHYGGDIRLFEDDLPKKMTPIIDNDWSA